MSKSLQSLHQQLQTLIASSPLQSITHPLLEQKQVKVSVKRDDQLHPFISGNKWRKLKYNLIEAQKQNKSHILSFGGAYSNHIHALAAAGYYLGFKTTAIIRGEPHYANNPTLKQAQNWGMDLQFVTRKEYKKRAQPDYLKALQQRFPDAFIVPEGGSNQFALSGMHELCEELLTQCDDNIDRIITATGSGGTLAGLISGFSQLHKSTKIEGIAVLKQANYLHEEVATLINKTGIDESVPWYLHTGFHGGGYAKVSQPLATFCQEFELQTSIPIEPIYTGKMFYALFELIKQDHFRPGEHIIALHTGGLQGRQGLKSRKKTN